MGSIKKIKIKILKRQALVNSVGVIPRVLHYDGGHAALPTVLEMVSDIK